MEIDQDLIKNIAKTARLDLSDDEVEMFVGDFKSILNYFEVLDEVDVSSEKMSIQPVKIECNLREDSVLPSLSNKDALKNSENKKDDYFMGPSAV